MAKTVQLDIVSAHEELFSGQVETVQLQGEYGELGIMPGHAPLMTSLIPGPVRIVVAGGEEQVFFVSGGMLEVQPRVVTVLADTAIRAQDLNEAAIKEAKARAEKLSNDKHDSQTSAEVAIQIAQSLAQIRTIERFRKVSR
jgi:F-type H+-transporting ATPase subunit epsilon